MKQAPLDWWMLGTCTPLSVARLNDLGQPVVADLADVNERMPAPQPPPPRNRHERRTQNGRQRKRKPA